MTNSYLLAHYYVDIFQKPIKIGGISVEFESYMEKENTSSWAFITAYNPMSRVLSPEENISRNEDLESKIKGYPYLHGAGRDPEGEWTPERSFLILDIKLEEATALAKEFEQKAIVYGEKGGVAELIMIQY